jgi:Ca2+-binding RTX toxin-like protein
MFRRPRPTRTTRHRRPPALRPLERLDERDLPSTLVLLDFNGATQDDLDRAARYAPAWPDHPTAGGLPYGFVAGFAILNSDYDRFQFLDFDGDGELDAVDGELAVNEVLANVRDDFAPYDVTVRREDSTGAALDAMRRNGGHDTLVFVNGGFPGEDPGGGGQAPRDDVGNVGQDVCAAGDTVSLATEIADEGSAGTYARNSFLNFMSSAIAHEVGHSFGLHHVDVTAEPLADDRNLMDPFLFDRNMSFWDISLTTDGGLQNQHQELTRVLGASRSSWAAVLRPGVLTVQTARSSATTYDVFAEGGLDPEDIRVVDGTRSVAYHVDTGSETDINSLNQFETPVTRLRFVGGSGADHLNVPASIRLDVYADGGGGADRISTGGGNDVIWGGDGADALSGGPGNDVISGLAGDDMLFGQAGDDRLYGGGANDVLSGGDGSDWLYGDSGRDILIGGMGADELYGGAGQDILIGGPSQYEGDGTILGFLRNEWATPRTYDGRVHNLRAGGGRNGTFRLEAKTVPPDPDQDQLYGEADRDWFWAYLPDVSDRETGESNQ